MQPPNLQNFKKRTSEGCIIFGKGLILWQIWVKIQKMLKIGYSVSQAPDGEIFAGKWLKHENFSLICKEKKLHKINNI